MKTIFPPGTPERLAQARRMVAAREAKKHARKPKASIRQNRWGNWDGYSGGKRVMEFAHEPAFLVAGESQGTDAGSGSEAPKAAQQWLAKQQAALTRKHKPNLPQ
jgi:hypothetical protein